MKANETPRYRIQWQSETIGVSDTADKAIRCMREVMGYELLVNGFKHINEFTVFDSKTECVLARSKDYDPLPV